MLTFCYRSVKGARLCSPRVKQTILFTPQFSQTGLPASHACCSLARTNVIDDAARQVSAVPKSCQATPCLIGGGKSIDKTTLTGMRPLSGEDNCALICANGFARQTSQSSARRSAIVAIIPLLALARSGY